MIFEDIKRIAKENELFGFEIPYKLYFTTIAFTVENDLLTPTFKFKRFEAKQFFLTVIKDLYDGAKL